MKESLPEKEGFKNGLELVEANNLPRKKKRRLPPPDLRTNL